MVVRELAKRKTSLTAVELAKITKKSESNIGNILLRLRKKMIIECRHTDTNHRCFGYKLTRFTCDALDLPDMKTVLIQSE